MFTVGDKIVYPMHGAGVIERIEEKEILGQFRRCYILRIPFGDMNVMIPVDSSEGIGVRAVVSQEKLARVLDVLGEDTSEMPGNWNKRHRENLEKLKSGNIEYVAEVVRNLMRTDRKKKLSTGEKKMLADAKQILISEIVLVRDIDQEAADRLIASTV